MTPLTRTVISRSPEETWAWASRLLGTPPAPCVIALHGELGAGKTCWVRGLARALGIDRPITSPTFTLVNEYRGTHALVHMDLYRIRSPDELLDLGFEEYLDAGGVIAVEWAEKAGDLMPPGAWHVRLEPAGPDERRITITGPSERVRAM
jgi:tRNA threonylcarbamoyladenosine biosynthesis protein TsaE